MLSGYVDLGPLSLSLWLSACSLLHDFSQLLSLPLSLSLRCGGGAIHSALNTKLVIKQSSFVGNAGKQGGAIRAVDCEEERGSEKARERARQRGRKSERRPQQGCVA